MHKVYLQMSNHIENTHRSLLRSRVIPQVKSSLNKKEWICSLFKEWILEKSEIRVNLEWTFVLFTHFGVTSGITRNPWVIPVVTPKWVNTNVHSKFTLISLFSKIHSLKSEHIHSFLFRESVSINHLPTLRVAVIRLAPEWTELCMHLRCEMGEMTPDS